MENMTNTVGTTQLGVIGVPATGTVARPWSAYEHGCVQGVHIAPMASVPQEKSVLLTALPTTVGVAAALRKDVFARSGFRTLGPPV
ncbi:hypothetical protein [Sporichthya polymorpha]|uniref:hypothetical protein n=1 Tax=Sporichthya polymorpha TaxID=35751 RepID=UPI0003AABD85|nr:hypothetical protein [Sporichthya polymorpha]